jgi:hypothetical protein
MPQDCVKGEEMLDLSSKSGHATTHVTDKLNKEKQ